LTWLKIIHVYDAIILIFMVHPPPPLTEPYSLTHLPVAALRATASTTYSRFLLPSGLKLFFELNLFMYCHTFSTAVTLDICSPVKMEHTQCSEKLGWNTVIRKVGMEHIVPKSWDGTQCSEKLGWNTLFRKAGITTTDAEE
jgi:hypothetical protein